MTTTGHDPATRTGEEGSHSPAARTILGLARIEGWRMVRHPATLVGLALSALAVASQIDVVPVLHRETIALSVFAGVPLALGVLIAAHLASTRPHRDDVDDLYGIAPTREVHRTGGLLVAAAWPAALAVAWVGIAIAYLYAVGGIWRPHPFDAAATPALVVLAGVTGVALGRWFRRPIAAPVAVIVLAASQVWLLTLPGQSERLALWADWGPGSPLGTPELWPRAPDIHLAWVLGLAGVGAALAVLRDVRRPAVVVAGVVPLVVAVLSAAALLRPIPEDEVQRLAAMAIDPSPHYVCPKGDGVEYCTLPAYRGWIDRWQPHVDGVIAGFPEDAVPGRLRIELGLGHGPFALLLSSDERRALEEQRLAMHPAVADVDGTVPVGPRQVRRGVFGAQQQFGIALDVAAEGLGFGGLVPLTQEERGVAVGPDEDAPGPAMVPCSVRGQAREAVALYLAGRATSTTERGLRHLVDTQPYGFHAPRGGGPMRVTYLHVTGTAALAGIGLPHGRGTDWSRASATFAAQLLDRPEGEVLDVLHADWSRWTDPATSVDELVAAFDLDPLPTPAQQLEELGLDPDAHDVLEDEVRAPCP